MEGLMDSKQVIIFDMDGVLVDSYAAHLASWRQLAEEVGLSLSEAQFLATFGRTSRESINQTWPERQFSDVEIERLDGRKEQIFRQLIEYDFPAMDGAVELIEQLNLAGFVLAVGSSGPRENVELALSKLRCRHAMQVVVSGSDVTLGKPDPEIYRTVAQRLDVPAQACIVVEDAKPGIAAAKVAGMSCIALHSSGHKREELLQADAIVGSLRKLTPRTFESLLERSLTFSTR
jgi:beta-phosphoglucomutase